MTAIQAACTELATLAQALAAALTRDATGTRGTSVSPGSVVNTDVLHAMITLRRHIPASTARACEVTGEPWQPRPIGGCLTAIPRLAGRMTVLGLLAEADELEGDVRWWVRLTKQALGLRTPDIPIGYDCPHHDEPAGLLAAGSEGFLRRSRDTLTVEWEHPAVVYCPHCGARWRPAEWLLLGRILQEAI